jgi:hypothetical protein
MEERAFNRGQRVRITLVGSAGFGLYGEVLGCDKRGDGTLYAVKCDGELITRWYTGDEITPVDIDQIHDSGERQEFTIDTLSTGETSKNKDDVPAPHLISPFALMREGKWMADNAKIHAPRNWEKGIPNSIHIASAARHLLKIMAGEHDEDHEAAVATRMHMLMHNQEMIQRGVLPSELSDMPNYGGDNGTTS